MSEALDDIRRNAKFYEEQVTAVRQDIFALEAKQRYAREQLEVKLLKAIDKAEDYKRIVELAEKALNDKETKTDWDTNSGND